MHSELREYLRNAAGESQFVIAVNIDIRGFSSFFSDSSQAAAFLSSAYTTILDTYFADLSFFKPTGDGLLLVREVDRSNLREVMNQYVSDALKLENAFWCICESDDMINFDTPRNVGIGLARGTATKISGEGKVLDFSGYPLNLASRLMDLARPHGVVFDASMGVHLLEDEFKTKFGPDAVYIKGLADLTPLTVHVSSDVEIPDANRRPFGAELFSEERMTCTFGTFKKMGPIFLHHLQHQPSTRDSVKLHVTWPALDSNGNKVTGVVTTRSVSPTRFVDHPEGLHASFDYASLISRMGELGVKDTWNVTRQLIYSVPMGTGASLGKIEATAAPELDNGSSTS